MSEEEMDLINRQDVIDAVTKYCTKYDLRELLADIEALTSAEQEQKTGRWINKTRNGQKNSECSECHTLFRVLIHDYPYCPVCGSKNRGVEDAIY